MQPMEFQDLGFQEIGDISSLVPANIMLIILAIVFVVAVVMSVVLLYHWRRYGANSRTIGLATIIYFSGVAVLLTVAAASATSF